MVGSNIVNSNLNKNYNLLTPSSKILNLLNKDDVDLYLIKHMPDIIIHCAGIVGGIQANINNPFKFLYENNVIGANIIKSSHENKIKNFINLGSSCIYPRFNKNPLQEIDILKGELEPTNEGYALAKIVNLKLCEYIYKTDELNYINIIPCNLYGPKDNFDPKTAHMIPSVIHKLHMAKQNNVSRIKIWGTGKVRREFMYVKDLVNLIEIVVDKMQKKEKLPHTFNAGINKDFSIYEYYVEIAKVVGYQGGYEFDLNKPEGMKQKLVDSFIAHQLGWKSGTSLHDGIKKTYQYYLNNYEKN